MMGRIKPSRRCPNPQKTMNVFKRDLRLLINLNKSIIWIILVRPVKSQGIGEEGGRIVSGLKVSFLIRIRVCEGTALFESGLRWSSLE